MNKIYSRLRLYLTLTSLSFCSLVSAENFWVLGSFVNSDAAVAQSTKLTDIIDAEVRIYEYQPADIVYHRLVVDEDALTSEVRQTLLNEHIEPWLMTARAGRMLAFDEPNERGDSGDAGLFQFLVGSYNNVEQALEIERQLADVFLNVQGKSQLKAGEVLHQVLVGPVVAADVPITKMMLSNLGYASVQVIEVPSVRSDEMDETDLSLYEVEIKVKPPRSSTIARGSTDAAIKTKASGFNLAKLPKKKPF